ncbi:MAG: aldo/keto reductase [Myxococcota bacterium]
MKRTELGNSGLTISRIVFGSMGRGTLDLTEQLRVLHAAIDAGSTSIDTAPLYEFGEVERTVGRAIKGRRDQVEVLSKVGLRWDDDHGDVLFEFNDATGARRKVRRDSRPHAIRKDVEESLLRLGTDYLDLCQIHHPDTRVPIEDSVGQLEELVREGKIRAVGVSNFTPPQIEAATTALGRIATNTQIASDQLEYNLLKRGPENEIFPLLAKHRIGLLAYSPLDAGSLAGTPFNMIRSGNRPAFQPANAAIIRKALRDSVAPVARQYDESIATICLAWLLHQEQVNGVVVGASHPDQAIANARAGDVVLRNEEVQSIGRRFAQVHIDTSVGLGMGERTRKLIQRARRKLNRIIQFR